MTKEQFDHQEKIAKERRDLLEKSPLDKLMQMAIEQLIDNAHTHGLIDYDIVLAIQEKRKPVAKK